MGNPLPRMLYVEDDAAVRQSVQRILASEYELTSAENGAVALNLLGTNDYDIILSDIEMPLMNGVTLYEIVAKSKPEQARRFVFYSGGYGADIARRLNNIPDLKLLPKPINLTVFRTTLASVAKGK